MASLVELLNGIPYDGEDQRLWLNLGYWKGQPSAYPAAAEVDISHIFRASAVRNKFVDQALAVAVAEAAHVRPGSLICDVGCGFGESLRLWRRRYASHAASVGINASPAEVAEATARGNHQVEGTVSTCPLGGGVGEWAHIR